MMNKISNANFYHMASYICAIRLFYEPVQSLDDLQIADELIRNYFQGVEEHFSLSAYSYTLHAHLHLKKQVLEHGPLKDNSQFFFEVSYYFKYLISRFVISFFYFKGCIIQYKKIICWYKRVFGSNY